MPLLPLLLPSRLSASGPAFSPLSLSLLFLVCLICSQPACLLLSFPVFLPTPFHTLTTPFNSHCAYLLLNLPFLRPSCPFPFLPPLMPYLPLSLPFSMLSSQSASFAISPPFRLSSSHPASFLSCLLIICPAYLFYSHPASFLLILPALCFSLVGFSFPLNFASQLFTILFLFVLQF